MGVRLAARRGAVVKGGMEDGRRRIVGTTIVTSDVDMIVIVRVPIVIVTGEMQTEDMIAIDAGGIMVAIVIVIVIVIAIAKTGVVVVITVMTGDVPITDKVVSTCGLQPEMTQTESSAQTESSVVSACNM